MGENSVTAEMMARLLRKFPGERGAKTRELFYKNLDFNEAMNTKTGQEILKDAIDIHEELLNKIGNLIATPEEAMEYKAIHKIITKWATRIVFHNKVLAELVKQ
jgi:hypothetical protein